MRLRVALADGTTEVDIKMLPDGRVCVHWLRECDDGPIVLNGHPELRKVMGKEPVGTYVLVCNPTQNTVNSQKRGSVRYMCMTSGDVNAVTCPKCLATPEAVTALAVPSESPAAAQMAADAIQAVGV